jgi:APA family basic amino acid/polyamine antiporter
MFSAWSFYRITGTAVSIFRHRHPSAVGTYRVPGYPLVPLIFVAMSVTLVVATLIENPKVSLRGVAMILSGILFYFLFFRTDARA